MYKLFFSLKMMNAGKSSESSVRQSSSNSQAATSSVNNQGSVSSGVLDKARLRDLVKEVDPLEQMDDDVEDVSTCIPIVISTLK